MEKKKEEVVRKPFTLTFGEFIDKLCIVSKKAMCDLEGAKKELSIMMDWCKEVGIDGEFILAIVRLAQTNMSIWDLEHSVRNSAEGSMPLSEVGRRSIMIRNTNKFRKEAQNTLDIEIGYVEEKIKHLSEDTYDKFYAKAGLKPSYKTLEEGGPGE
jgi:hypothetical protein